MEKQTQLFTLFPFSAFNELNTFQSLKKNASSAKWIWALVYFI